MPGFVQDPRVSVTVTIASATSLSGAVDLGGYRVAALDMSSGWDAANRMTFRVSQDSSTYYDLYDDAGNMAQIASGTPLTSSTGRSIVPAAALVLALASHRYLKIQSGPSSAPVNLSTGVTIAVVLAPY